MRRCSGLLAVVVLALPLQAQQTFSGKIEVSLVNVDVTVTSHGKAVRGLTREDFEVLEDGVPQTITNFYAVTGVAAAAPAAGPSTAATAEAAAATLRSDERFRRHVLLLIDNSHLTRFNRDRALGSLEQFINDRFKGGEYDWSIATVSDGTRLLLPQTSDKSAIHNALNVIRRAAARGVEIKDLRGNVVAIAPTDQPPPAGGILSEIDIRENLYDALPVQRAIVDAVRAFAGTPGKKIVLLVTSDVGLRTTGEPAVDRAMTTLRDALIHEVNAANVNLYILGAEGMALQPVGYMYWLARETGGRYMTGNVASASMRQFDESSANFYSLAYRPPHTDDEQYHRIVVRLRKCADCELRYREGYATLPREVEIARALATPLSATMLPSSLPLTATTGQIIATHDGVTVPIQARVPLKELQFVPADKGWKALVDIYVSVFDENGRNLTLERFTTTATAPAAPAEGDLIHNATVTFGVGKPRTIVVAVRDETNEAFGVWQQTVGF